MNRIVKFFSVVMATLFCFLTIPVEIHYIGLADLGNN